MRSYIHAYNNGSASAHTLRANLGMLLLRKVGSSFQASPDKILFNWGASAPHTREMGLQDTEYNTVVNSFDKVALASNKIKTFEALAASPLLKYCYVPFTTSRDEVERWIADGKEVVARHKLTGHSGEGIEIISSLEQLEMSPPAPLYTMYVKKRYEFRVHTCTLERFPIFIQTKARKRDVPDEKVDWKVRNLSNGFIYKIGEENTTPSLRTRLSMMAKRTLIALGLDFGAVDIIYNERQDKLLILEVNTAPGLGGESTLSHYQNVFNSFKDVIEDHGCIHRISPNSINVEHIFFPDNQKLFPFLPPSGEIRAESPYLSQTLFEEFSHRRELSRAVYGPEPVAVTPPTVEEEEEEERVAAPSPTWIIP